MALDAIVRRNTLILAGAMALNWAVIVIVAALTTLTIAHLFGLPELAGLGFGAFLLAYAAGGLMIGRLMDAWGRRNGLGTAFIVGAGGAMVMYAGVGAVSLPISLAGLLIVGLGTGGANLARVAGADMYAPSRRAHGISLVLFGAAFGAIGAPIVFGPALAGAQSHQPGALAAPWPIAALVLLAGALLLSAIRLDPRRIAEQLLAAAYEDAGEPQTPEPSARPLTELLALPLVPFALLAAIVAQAVMTSIMALAGLVLADHGHDLSAISLTVSIHFVGMFGLVLVVGRLIDRLGHLRAVVLGLLVLAGGVLALLPGAELLNFVPGMFAVGVGWNVAFVASTTILATAARPNERGRLLGASDFIALCAAAVLSVVSGLILGTVGLEALVVVGVLLALVPALLIFVNRSRLERAPAA